MQSLDGFARAKLADLASRSERRLLAPTHRLDGVWVQRGGRQLLSFSCNDYLGLSHHPAVKAAAKAAIDAFGAGAGASRLVTGNHPLMTALEDRLAALKGTEAACVFGSGYLANIGIIPTFVGGGDAILIDEFAHACLWAGARLSRANVLPFRHNDLEHLGALLATHRGEFGHILIATDGVFSMDGDLAPLAEMQGLASEYDAWLLVDDAHGLGVLGGGRGSVHAANAGATPLQMGTLSKAAGGYGGYLCGSRSVVDLIKNRARTLVYSTGLPPAAAGAAIAALKIIQADPLLCAEPLRKARRFSAAIGATQAQSSIVPVLIGAADRAMAASHALEERGFLVVAIRPPTVPKGTARLRIAFAAGHPDADIERLAGAVLSLGRATA